MKKRNLASIILAVTMLLGRVTASADVTARISQQEIYVDGQAVDLLAYNINENNYVRLRDIGKAVDFSVFYDVSTDSVRLDRKYGYTGDSDILPTPGDNPTAILSEQKIFVSGVPVHMTAYNISDNNYVKLRDIGAALNFAIAYDEAADAVYIDRQTAYLPNMTTDLLRPEAIPGTVQEIPNTIEPTEKSEISGRAQFIMEYLPEEYAAVKPFIDGLDQMETDVEKVNAIVRYVCERMDYGEPDDPSIYTRMGLEGGHPTKSMRYAMFLDAPPIKGLCIDYSKAVSLLCGLAEIHEILIISYASDHAWNAVYTENGWFYVDATNDDSDDGNYDDNFLFSMDTPNLPFSDENAEQTKELMEQLVPGSTK